MLNRRWWDVAVAAGSVVIAAALLMEFGPREPWRLALGVAAIALFALGYVAVGRAAIGLEPGWRFPVFVALAALSVGVGSAAAGFLAMMLALAYPLAWVIGVSRRHGIIASAVIAFAVACGIAVGGGLDAGSIVTGLATGAFSFAFSVAFGLWIAGIAEYGEERARLLAELQAAQSEVEALSRDRGASLERERLARDIHDTLAQTLAGLVILAERAGRLSREGRTDAATTAIATVEQTAREALGEARALVARTAAVPSEPAFDAAVERLVERFRAEAGLTISVDSQGSVASIERDTQVVLLRCVQEALANVRKHAGATHATVRVAVTADGAAELEVADDGSGFDPLTPRSGFGLDGMSERVALAGGELELESSPARGTTLRVRLPATSSLTGGTP